MVRLKIKTVSTKRGIRISLPITGNKIRIMKKIFILLGIALLLSSFAAKYETEIISVYDGDTVTARVHLGLDISKIEKLRLYGLNAPEVRGSKRYEGLKSRDALRAKLKNAEVVHIYTMNDKRGKYGRLLAIIHADGVNINKWLIEEGFAEKKDY